jgi:hypothetical protein
LEAGGKRPLRLNSFFSEPTAFANCHNGMRFCREEVSCPLMSLQPSSIATGRLIAGSQIHRQLPAASVTNRVGAGYRVSCRLAEWWGNLPIGMTYWS